MDTELESSFASAVQYAKFVLMIFVLKNKQVEVLKVLYQLKFVTSFYRFCLTTTV